MTPKKRRQNQNPTTSTLIPQNNTKKPSAVSHCNGHSGHEAQLRSHGKQLDDYHKDQTAIWQAVKNKVDIKLFTLLVVIFIGNVGFQFTIYNMVKDVGTTVAVIKTELKSHSTWDKYSKFPGYDERFSGRYLKDRLDNGGR